MANMTYRNRRLNRAYAEGRFARANGLTAADNPWAPAFAVEEGAWDEGYAAPNGTLDDTAYSGVTGLPAPVLNRGEIEPPLPEEG
jgi:hypothetical protein